MRTKIWLFVAALLTVSVAHAQGSPEDAYKQACTIPETDLAVAAETFGTTVEEVEYVNRSREYYRADHLIRPGCFFSTELNQQPLYADVSEPYTFLVQVIEADLTFSQIAPEGYFGDEGYMGYHVLDFSYVDDESRWVITGQAVLTGVMGQFGGHAVAFSGGEFGVSLSADWIGQTFRYTKLVPAGPILTVTGWYDVGENPPLQDATLNAIDYDSGDWTWSVELETVPRDLLVLSPQVAVLVYEDHLAAYDVADGSPLWEAAYDAPLIAVATDGALAVWSTQTLRVLSASDGAPLWDVETDAADCTHLAYAAGQLAVACSQGRLAAYDATQGALRWETTSEARLSPADVQCDAQHDCWLASAGPNGAVLEQFDFADGHQRATYTLAGEDAGSPLHVRVQPDGWVLSTGEHLHARTPLLAH